METNTGNTAAAHLVIVYPQNKDTRSLLNLAAGLERGLAKACGEAPVQIRPDVTALCLLAHGTHAAIRRAVDDVTDAYSHWIVLRVDTPYASNGLSTADQWLRRHC
jgi:hypothetical protein